MLVVQSTARISRTVFCSGRRRGTLRLRWMQSSLRRSRLDPWPRVGAFAIVAHGSLSSFFDGVVILSSRTPTSSTVVRLFSDFGFWRRRRVRRRRRLRLRAETVRAAACSVAGRPRERSPTGLPTGGRLQSAHRMTYPSGRLETDLRAASPSLPPAAGWRRSVRARPSPALRHIAQEILATVANAVPRNAHEHRATAPPAPVLGGANGNLEQRGGLRRRQKALISFRRAPHSTVSSAGR